MNWTGEKNKTQRLDLQKAAAGQKDKLCREGPPWDQADLASECQRPCQRGFIHQDYQRLNTYPVQEQEKRPTEEKKKKTGNILLCDLKHDMSVEAMRTDVIDWVGKRWLGGDRVEERHRVIKIVDSPISWTQFTFVSHTGRFFNLPVDGAMALEIVKAGQKPELIITLDIGGVISLKPTQLRGAESRRK